MDSMPSTGAVSFQCNKFKSKKALSLNPVHSTSENIFQPIDKLGIFFEFCVERWLCCKLLAPFTQLQKHDTKNVESMGKSIPDVILREGLQVYYLFIFYYNNKWRLI